MQSVHKSLGNPSVSDQREPDKSGSELELTLGGARLQALDLLALGYPTLIAVVLAARSPPDRAFHIGLLLAYWAFALFVIRRQRRHSESPWWFTLRVNYGVFVLVVTFLQIGQLQPLLYNDYWFTPILVNTEHSLFGVHPPLWVSKLYSPWLSELMSFFHLAYYAMPVLLIVPMMRQQRRAELRRAITIGLLTYVVVYSVYLFLPAMNPRTSSQLGPYYVAPPPAYLFAWLEHAIQGDKGTVLGNCFPSGHAGGATIWALLTGTLLGWKHWAAVLNGIVAVGTSLATVYLGFHHALDPIAGVLLAALLFCATSVSRASTWPSKLDSAPRVA